MSLLINRIQLTVETLNGAYGCNLSFSDGLVLLHKDNTRGKSTALKATIYGLGLERMFGSADIPPLPPATTLSLRDGENEWPVQNSFVVLEVANRRGDIVTLRRKISGEGGPDRKLVGIWSRSLDLTESFEVPEKALYARDKGSASRQQGLYSFLADFVGWKLPDVHRFDGTTAPLYIESLMSLFFIEQSQGWTSIQAGIPRFFQIKNIERKAIEFVLAMDSGKSDLQRQELEQQEERLLKSWQALSVQFERLSASIGGVVRNFPERPSTSWPLDPAPFLETYVGGRSIPLSEALVNYEVEYRRLTEEAIPTADQASIEANKDLSEALAELDSTGRLIQQIRQDVDIEISSLEALNFRQGALGEDLEHNKGEKKVRDLGFSQALSLTSGECPTCHQYITDALLEQDDSNQVMTLDENISYLEGQLQTLNKVRSRIEGRLGALRRRLSALENYSRELSASIRSLRQTLVSPGTSLSEEFVRRKLLLENWIAQFISIQQTFEGHLPTIKAYTDQWVELQKAKADIKNEQLSKQDRDKLSLLQSCFLSALEEFGFESFPVSTITIDWTTFKPTRQGFDISYDVSASDNIRVISAYLIALLEVARTFPTNHLGLLILDEPRQQNMKWSHFTKVLRRLSTANGFAQQVIVATSDQPDRVAELSKTTIFSTVDESFELPLLRKL